MQPYQNIRLNFRCPKAFNELKPCSGGWYCDGCHKMVHDFRGMSETQIREAFIKSGKGLCGMYDADRMAIAPNQPKIKKWLSAVMVTLGFAGLHHTAMSQTTSPPVERSKTETSIDTINSDKVFGTVSDIEPQFIGGNEKFQKLIAGSLQSHPDFIGKRVLVTFVIEKDGNLSDVKITRGINAAIDNEVLTAFKKSPKWQPGMQNGKLKRTQYTMPITIKD